MSVCMRGVLFLRVCFVCELICSYVVRVFTRVCVCGLYVCVLCVFVCVFVRMLGFLTSFVCLDSSACVCVCVLFVC